VLDRYERDSLSLSGDRLTKTMGDRTTRNLVPLLLGAGAIFMVVLLILLMVTRGSEGEADESGEDDGEVLESTGAEQAELERSQPARRNLVPLDREAEADVAHAQHVKLVSASGLEITKAFVRRHERLTSVPVRESLIAHEDLLPFVDPSDLLIVPGHEPVPVPAVAGQEHVELHPDLWLEIRHDPGELRSVSLEFEHVQKWDYLDTALWGRVDEQTWAFILCLSGFPGQERKLPVLEEIGSLYLADGSGVFVSVWLEHGRHAILDLASLARATAIVPLRVLVERGSAEIGDVDVELVVPVADLPEPEPHVMSWGRVSFFVANRQIATLERGESEVVFGLHRGGLGIIQAVAKVEDRSWIGGVSKFEHDGSPRIVQLRRAHVVTGRLVDPDRRTIARNVLWKWKETAPVDGLGVSRESGLEELATPGGRFSVSLMPPWRYGIALSQVEVTFKAPGFEDASMTIDCSAGSESNLGDVLMIPAEGPRVDLVVQTVEQRGAVLSAGATGINVFLLRQDKAFNLRAKSVLDVPGQPLTVVLGDADGSNWSPEFEGVMRGDAAILTLAGSVKHDRKDQVLFAVCDRNGSLVVVPQHERVLEVEGDVAPGEAPVTLEWRWPVADGYAGFTILTLGELSDGVEEDAREIRLQVPENDVWLVWRRGEQILGRVKLSSVDGALRIP